MPSSIDYRSALEYPADEVYATMVDPEYLRARLREIGGPGAELLEHTADVDGARYRLRHGLSASDLPSIVRNLMPGDISIERTESLKRNGANSYDGSVAVEIHGTPASAAGWMRLAENGAGSELRVHADVSVRVPLIGGRIEAVVAEQVQKLLAAETAFTVRWMQRG